MRTSKIFSVNKGFIGTLILLILVAAAAGAIYFMYTNYAKTPNEKTTKVAAAIYKYPNSSSWEIKESKNFCLTVGGCDQPIRILFESQNEWGTIYSYYKTYMTQSGWTSNSFVLTSIPSSAVFKRADKCQVAMENHNELKYSFTVSCPDQ